MSEAGSAAECISATCDPKVTSCSRGSTSWSRSAADSGAPAEIYHFKQAGQSNWGKLDAAIAKVDAARASGQRITANMYTYTAGATGLDATMPPWVQSGGLEAWEKRLQDPAVRARLLKEMRTPSNDWENLFCCRAARTTCSSSASRTQAETADGQDARRSREDARQEPRRDRDGLGRRGRQSGRNRLFHHERGQCEARDRPCRG